MSVDKAKLRDDILASVKRTHAVTTSELIGPSRDPEAVAARADAAQRLKMAGFRAAHIARILKRNPTVIGDYLHGQYRGGKNDGRFVSMPFGKHLPREVRDVVIEMARISNTTPEIILAEWICERATYELEAKSREAA
jgi:hypothetical protein